MPVDADAFRRALALWPSGVSIVTARAGDDIHGMTASAFASVSLAPPLVLVCLDQQANTLALLRRGRNMAINVLAETQRALSARFASKEHEWTRFAGLTCARAKNGAPLIPGAHMALACTVTALHEAGDHVIAVGLVEEAVVRDGPPLIYYGARYRKLAPPSDGDGDAK